MTIFGAAPTSFRASSAEVGAFVLQIRRNPGPKRASGVSDAVTARGKKGKDMTGWAWPGCMKARHASYRRSRVCSPTCSARHFGLVSTRSIVVGPTTLDGRGREDISRSRVPPFGSLRAE